MNVYHHVDKGTIPLIAINVNNVMNLAHPALIICHVTILANLDITKIIRIAVKDAIGNVKHA